MPTARQMRSQLLHRHSRLAAAWLLPLLLAGVPHPAGAAGGLAVVDHQENGAAGVVGLKGVLALALSPDGANLYTASDVSSALAVFARNGATGALSFVERQLDNTGGVDGLDHVRALAVSPDGLNLYAAGEQDDALAVFQRDPATGGLIFVEVQRNGVGGVSGLDGVDGVIVSADGANVYAASGNDNGVAIFERDPSTGVLTFDGVQRNGSGGVSGLGGAEGLAMSPDDLSLYVASPGDNSVAVFQRDPLSGSLTFLERHQHSATVADGLDGVRSIVVSPDGQSVYAAGKLDDAVALFSRDGGSGALTFIERKRDQVDGIDGLDGVEALALSPDGQYLYAAASRESSVAVFLRDSATGTLTFVELQRDGVGTIETLKGANSLVLGPDGTYVYVGAAGANAVTAFSTRCGDGVLDPGEQCDDGNSTNQDGCSAGCRRECGAAADCDDGDRCTEEHCRAGECALPQCGFQGAMCEINAAIPALQAMDVCLPLQRQLGRTIRTHLRLARQMVHLVQHPPPPPLKKNGKPKKQKKVSTKKLVADVGKLLTRVQLKTAKLEQRAVISPACAAGVSHATEILRGALNPTLQRKGLCTP